MKVQIGPAIVFSRAFFFADPNIDPWIIPFLMADDVIGHTHLLDRIM
jgi:hypothetical protein